MKNLDKVLSEAVNKALEVAENTGEFVIEQAPLLLIEFYNWHISKSILMIIIFLVVMFLLRYISFTWGVKNKSEIPKDCEDKYIQKSNGRYYHKSSYYGDNCDGYNAYLMLNVIKFIPLIGVCVWAYNLVFILIAPKLYLIEYFIN